MNALLSYPRKVRVMAATGFVALLVDDRLREPLPFVFWFEPGEWVTEDMCTQVWETLKPCMLPGESPWVFGYHQGVYQARKLNWHVVGYVGASWPELLALIMRCYYAVYISGEFER